MNGAGCSLYDTIVRARMFAKGFSSNAGSAAQEQAWIDGWKAAEFGIPNGLGGGSSPWGTGSSECIDGPILFPTLNINTPNPPSSSANAPPPHPNLTGPD